MTKTQKMKRRNTDFWALATLWMLCVGIPGVMIVFSCIRDAIALS